jgi:hypothetical protein
MLLPFSPKTEGTVSLAATTTSGSTTVALAALESPQLEINNTGSVWVFVNWGSSSVAATVGSGATGGSYPVGPGSKVVVTVNQTTVTHAAAITSTGTATVYLTPGLGQ